MRAVEIDHGQPVSLERERHEAIAQWELKDSGPLDGAVHIQVGTLASGGWYVNHMGFGVRRFTDKQAAWDAVRGLMDRHEGRWERVEPDSRPFLAVRRPDGSRVLYDMNGKECLHACWGGQKDRLCDKYFAAIDAGERLRETETHQLSSDDGGYIDMVRYRDPLDDSQRYVVTTSYDAVCYIVDFPDHDQAEAEYVKEVYANQDDETPYKSCDIADIKVDRKSRPPEGLTVLPDGTAFATADREEYNRTFGLPLRIEWPRTTELAVPPGPVSGMTAEPRDWGPTEVSVRNVTPAAWQQTREELAPNDLALVVLPDGRQLFASAHDDAARVWSLGDGKDIRMVSGHSEWVLSVALTVLSDGDVVLATGGKDGLARAWSARQGDALQELREAHDGPVNSVAWACPLGDVPWLITGGDDATVRVWDIERELSLRVLEVGEPSLQLVWSVAAAVLSNGDVCVVAGIDDCGDDAVVHVWNAATKTAVPKFVLQHKFVLQRDSMSCLPKVAVATLADRSFRVAAIAGSVVRIWDGHTGHVVRTLPAPPGRSGDIAMAVLPDLRVVVAATNERETLVWDVESGAVLARLDHTGDGFRACVDLVARPDGGLLLVTGKPSETPARVVRLDLRW
jgi:WD40 repeat protein